MDEIRACIHSRFDEVPTLVAAVRPLLDACGKENRAKAEIGLHEIVHNIIEHGYGKSPQGCIHLRAGFLTDLAWIELVDEGKPHPGYSAASPSPVDDLLAMEERGRGLWLIQECFYKVTYTRAETRNRTVLHIRLI